MGRSSVQSAAAVRLVCLDGVGSCVVVSSLARGLSLSLWAGLVIGDSWGHIGDTSDIAVDWRSVCVPRPAVSSFLMFFVISLLLWIPYCSAVHFAVFSRLKKKSIVYVSGRQLFGASPL